MNIAIIKAGGVGSRMGAGIPKQFVLVDNKPVIVYTLEVFEQHPNIDEIIVVCVSGWEKILKSYADTYHITKIKKIVPGGATSLRSIKNGLEALQEYGEDNVILIHDANRPLVTQEIISGVLAEAHIYGMAVAAIPCTDEVAVVDVNDISVSQAFANHKELVRIQTPDAYSISILRKLFSEVTEEQLDKIGATNVLAIINGYIMHFAMGSELNIRLTTQDDLVLFESIFKSRNKMK